MNHFQIVPPLHSQEIPLPKLMVERCVCCWVAAHPDQPYPVNWSSTLCPPHARWTRQRRLAARRGQRRA